MKRPMRFVSALILVLISLVSLAPFYLMMTMSTYKTEMIFKGLPLLPSNYFMTNLSTVLQSNFIRAYGNSLLVSVSAAAACVLISAMAGYALNVFVFPGRQFLSTLVMLIMMVPTQIGVVGYMIEMRTLRMTNTLWPVIITWFANGFGVFWMIQFIGASLPTDIVESARIDGSNELRTFFQIAIPCIRPGLITLALLIFLWSWNSYLVPLVFINNQDLYTIPIFIKSLANAYRTDYGAQLTGLVFSTLPLILLFIFGSKNFIKGLTAGAVKG